MKHIKIISIGLLLAACGGSVEQHGHPDEMHVDEGDTLWLSVSQINNIDLSTTMVREVEIGERIATTGFLDVPPGYRAQVHSLLPCVIQTIKKMEGSQVKKGELLMEGQSLEFIDLQKTYLMLGSELAVARQEYERQSQLKDVSAQKTWQQTEATLKSKEAEYEAVKNKLKLLRVNLEKLDRGEIQPYVYFYSPIAGKVSRLNVAVGQHTSENTSLMEIIDNHHLHVELNIYENNINRIYEGQKIKVKVPGLESPYDGHVFLKSNSLQENRSIKVHAHFDNEEVVEKEGFVIGQFVEVEMLVGSKKVMALPAGAVFKQERQPHVFVVAEKSPERWAFLLTKISAGAESEGFVEVKDFDDPSVEVVDQGLYYLVSAITEAGGHGH